MSMHYNVLILIDRTLASWFKCQWWLLCWKTVSLGAGYSVSNGNKLTTFRTARWAGFSSQLSFKLAFVKPFMVMSRIHVGGLKLK